MILLPWKIQSIHELRFPTDWGKICLPKSPMEKEFLLSQLEELAGKLGIAIRYENVTTEESAGSGGLCRMKGDYFLIIHSQAAPEEKVRIFLEALKLFPLGDIYVKPAIRELLEEFKE
jgi:hypothetical protein